MKSDEIRKLSDEELGLEIERAKRTLFEIRSQAVTEKLEDPSMVTKGRRDIARMLTIAAQRRDESQASSAQKQS